MFQYMEIIPAQAEYENIACYFNKTSKDNISHISIQLYYPAFDLGSEKLCPHPHSPYASH